MNDQPEPAYLPISCLNQLEYCERRFWLMHVQGEMEINAPVLEGIYQHRRAHSPGSSRDKDRVVHRRVAVWSDRLRLTGYADLVEEQAGGDATRLIPVEHKRGKMGQWLNDHVQLCAQAMCLEERLGHSIPHGEIFYWRSRRRVSVPFTPELRARTEAAVQRAFQLLARGRMPAPEQPLAKCRDCSLEPVCLPREIKALHESQNQSP